MLRRYREERVRIVRQYVGQHWSEEGSPEKIPVNLLSLYVRIVGRNLIAKNPRMMLSTFDRGMKATVSAMESWGNREIERMNLEQTLRRIVVDGLFSVGIAKIALASPAEAAAVNWQQAAGQAFVERVDLDDFVFDAHARDFDEAGYMGHRYRVPLEVVREDKSYSKYRKELAASSDSPYNLEGDERVSTIGRGQYAGNSEEFEDYVDLWEIYLPRRRLVLTLADDHLTGAATAGTAEPLRAQTWVGPDRGPYRILGYELVPGNAMPKGPMQDLVDLHEAANRSYRKVIRTADRIKELTLVQGGAMEDGSRAMQANDGDIIRCDNPERIKPFVHGGSALQSVLAVATACKDLFNVQAGNLELLGGAGPQSKTAAQDEMLNTNASRGISDYQDRTINFTSEVMRSLCWYWWHDPFNVQRSRHALPGLPEISIERQVTPQMRQQGKFEDLDIQVDPYSMQHASPQARMAALNQVVTQIVIPLGQLLQSQGVAFDINAYLKKMASYMDMPDLAEIVTIQEPPQEEGGSVAAGGEEPGGMPQETTRNYVRENVSQRSRQGNDQDMISRMLGHEMGGTPEANGQPMMNGQR